MKFYNKELSRRYAVALFSLVLEESKVNKGRISDFEKEIILLRELYVENSKLATLLANPVIKITDKSEIIKNLSDKSGYSDVLKSFLLTLVKNGRFAILPEIIEEIMANILVYQNKAEIVVYSTKELDANTSKYLSSHFSESLQQEIVIKNIVDKNLLGGMKIKFGVSTIDFSFTKKINDLRKHLLC